MTLKGNKSDNTSIGGTLTTRKIAKLKDDTDKFFEYHKRIVALKKYIIRFPKLRIKYAQEIMICQEEQARIRQRSREQEQEQDLKKC